MESSDLFSYFEQLSPIVLDRLYACQWACQCILQSLQPVEKQIVTRLCPVDDPLPVSTLKSWLYRGAGGSFDKSLKKLRGLRLIVDVDAKGMELHDDGQAMDVDVRYVKLNPPFQAQTRTSIEQGIPLPWKRDLQTGRRLKDDQKAPTLDQIESYSKLQWNRLLHFIVGSDELEEPAVNMVSLLVSMNLMAYVPSEERVAQDIPVLTNYGYEFMLMDTQQQIWTVMKFYTDRAERPDDVLQMLFRLSFCKPGSQYVVAALTPDQQGLLHDFNDFGLVYRRTIESRRFYPTSMGVSIVFGHTSSIMGGPARGLVAETQELKVVVETNFKVYAYTGSRLHCEMIGLFVNMETILPNMVVGVITRDSVRDAFKKGISAKQLINFLKENAHQKCKDRVMLVPDNVTDQILLWEEERARVKMSLVHMYSSFADTEEFDQVCNRAQELGILKWSNREKMRLVVEDQYNDLMRQYLRSRKQR